MAEHLVSLTICSVMNAHTMASFMLHIFDIITAFKPATAAANNNQGYESAAEQRQQQHRGPSSIGSFARDTQVN